MLAPVIDQPPFPMPPRRCVKKLPPEPLAAICLSERQSLDSWIDLSSVKDQFLISLNPSRPETSHPGASACIKLKTSQMVRRIHLPGRIDFAFQQNGVLMFSDAKTQTPFWADFSLDDEGKIVCLLTAVTFHDKQSASFRVVPDLPPSQKGEDFPAGGALFALAEAKWWGMDLVAQLDSSEPKQRLEIGSTFLEVGLNDWMGWKEGGWTKIKTPLREGPIARIRSVSHHDLEWDVWDGTVYHRLTLSASPSNSRVVPKIEEWFSSLRIRSDKQISCMIEKQCFILRVGDWVLKENGKWRILRKKEEKDQLLAGAKSGELFVLDQIERGQKSIRGRMFLAHRTQSLPVEIAAVNKGSTRRSKEKLIRSSERAG